MPQEFATNPKSRSRYPNLLDYVQKWNNESGRAIYENYEGGKLTVDNVVEWFNKAPLVRVEGLYMNNAVLSTEKDMTWQQSDNAKNYTDHQILDDLSHLPTQSIKGSEIKTDRIVSILN